MAAAPIGERELRELSQGCLVMRARLVARALTGLYEEALRPHGLKAAQMNLLVAVGALGAPRPAALGELLQLDPSTLSRTLERLRGQRLLEAAPDPDGRATPVRLSAKGRRLLGAALPAWRAAQRRARERLGEQGAAALLELGDRLVGRP